MQSQFYQYLNFKCTYLFTVKNSSAVKLHIFDMSPKRVFKCTISDSTLVAAIRENNLDIHSIKASIPNEYRIAEKGGTKIGHIMTNLLDNIRELVTEIFANKTLNCPITRMAPKDPVIDTMGHTFEKSAIRRWVDTKSNLCPIPPRHKIVLPLIKNTIVKRIIDDIAQGKEPAIPNYKEPVVDERGDTHEKAVIEKFLNKDLADSIKHIPNRMVKDFLERNRVKMIPTFSLFKKSDPRNAKRFIQKALHYTKHKRYAEALQCYSKAFKYTNDWRYYSNIPSFFEMLDQHDKALLAYLYLVKYQLAAGDVADAIKTVNIFKKKDLFLDINPILSELYMFANKPQQAFDLLMKSIKESHSKTLLPYNDVLERFPSLPYDELADLVASPKEKAHILYRGALEAFFAKHFKEAEQLAQRASEYHQHFLNVLALLKIDKANAMEIESTLFDIARRLSLRGLWEKAHIIYKMIPQEKYERVDHANRYLIYVKLQKRDRATDRLLQDMVNMGEKEWDFSDYYLTNKDIKIVIANMPKTLESLNLTGSNLKKEIKNFAQQLPKTLKTLIIDMCYIGPVEIKALAPLFPKTLTRLSFRYNNLEARGAIVLAKFLPKNLQVLDLFFTGIGNVGAVAICRRLPSSLRILSFSRNYLHDFVVIEFVRHFPNNLHILDLSYNYIRNLGAMTLVHRLYSSNLHVLKINNNLIQFYATATFFKKLPATLQCLDITYNKIDDIAKKSFREQCKHIREFHI